MKMKKTALLLAPVLGVGGALVASAPAFAAEQADSGSSWSYQANLDQMNDSGASGTVMITGDGDQANVTMHVEGLAKEFNGDPYPHVQHIHIGGQGTCPTPSADKNGDGIVDTVEGQDAYGMIGTTLSTKGDTSPDAGTDLKVAGQGGSYDYKRSFTMNDDTVKALQDGTAVVVVHGLDPSNLSKKAQGEKSNLVKELPLAATSPALCGPLEATQMGTTPNGPVQTGGGGTSTGADLGMIGLGAGLVLVGGGAYYTVRRVTQKA